MTHHKSQQSDHHAGIGLSPPESEGALRPFFKSLGVYLSRHWAWPVIIGLWWYFRTHPNLSDAAFVAIILVTAIVVILGWSQLATISYWRGYFAILLVFAGVMVFFGAFPILFILFLLAIIAVGIDLFFIAPHRGL